MYLEKGGVKADERQDSVAEKLSHNMIAERERERGEHVTVNGGSATVALSTEDFLV